MTASDNARNDNSLAATSRTATSPPCSIKLSICIATFNRAAYIGETIDSIASQVTSDCEIVISDNASSDNTEQVVVEYARRYHCLRYVKQSTNVGLDRNFDRAVELAQGEYCWLMADDDVLKPEAVALVLDAIRRDFSLIILNYERRDRSMTNVLLDRFLDVHSDAIYAADELDRLFAETATLLLYIGCVVIKRNVWLTRDRERYYDSMWIHLGIIFQERFPSKVLMIAKPLVSYRDGNAKSYFGQFFEILTIKLPSLFWALPVSDAVKKKIMPREPWRNPRWLLFYRAAGCYSLGEYRRLVRPRLHSRREAFIPALVARFPGVLLNLFYVLYCSVGRNRYRLVRLQMLKDSPYYPLSFWTSQARTVSFNDRNATAGALGRRTGQ